MPHHTPSLDERTVRDLIEAHLLAPVPTRTLGLELEWLTSDPTDRLRRPGLDEVRDVVADLGPLPGRSTVMIEPGGQLELATLPLDGVDALCRAAADDLFHLDRAITDAGLELVALGTDPDRAPLRITTEARYRAMEAHFDRRSGAGRTMMCNTASIQLNVGRGADHEVERRWRTANALGPVLIAAFANSPFVDGRVGGWASTRLRTWWRIDPSRTAPVRCSGHLVDDWTRFALDASVMLIRRADDDYLPLTRSLSLAEWLAVGHEAGWPDEDDLAYHLTTLFPPVRPRGWLELRMFDALPTPFWHVAVAVATALLDLDEDEVERAVGPTTGLWLDAAQLGLGHPALAHAAQRCFTLARERLEELGTDAGIQAVVATYDERWVQRGRCPADDALDRWRSTGDPYPPSRSPVPFAELEASVS